MSVSAFGKKIEVGTRAWRGAATDCNGHGTHVARTLGGKTYGVAKKVNLRALRVFDCSGNGTVAGILSAINWLTPDFAAPAVANMSVWISAAPHHAGFPRRRPGAPCRTSLPRTRGYPQPRLLCRAAGQWAVKPGRRSHDDVLIAKNIESAIEHVNRLERYRFA
jgi:subtilisin family serine protease